MSKKSLVRATIYTRKSSEEGLDQEFNSLDAQYEACAAYIESQRHEGWRRVKNRYDDGGLSGGTLERPALQRLMQDIRSGQVQMIVVYKIDRLTRSLTDFAKLIETLEAHDCSFVSVTQSFNTSSSMGRLTLNVLLSFAQFEREVTAERIRDKLKASKKKGLWMGGLVPMGYKRHPDKSERTLVPDPDEAQVIETIFKTYDRLECLRLVMEEIEKQGIRSKVRGFANGRKVGGRVMTRGQIHYLLTNPIYIGKIRHKAEIYEGLHPAIIKDTLWERVQKKLQTSSAKDRGRDIEKSANSRKPLLIGKLYDDSGARMRPSYTVKNEKRHHYYVSPSLMKGEGANTGWRIPAKKIEQLAREITIDHLEVSAREYRIVDASDATTLASATTRAGELVNRLKSEDIENTCGLISQINLQSDTVELKLDRDALAQAIEIDAQLIPGGLLSIRESLTIQRRGVEMKLVSGTTKPEPDKTLQRALHQAHGWLDEIKAGARIADIAQQQKCTRAHIRRRTCLAFLSPKIQHAILNGTHPSNLTLERIIRSDVPDCWREQEALFGITS